MTHSRSWDVEIWWPSVENVTLGLYPRVTFQPRVVIFSMPAFAAACRDHQPLAVQQSIDISCSLGPQQQTCFSGLWWPGEIDRLTDARQLYGPCSAYFVGSANKQLHAIIAIYPSFSVLGGCVTKWSCNVLQLWSHWTMSQNQWYQMSQKALTLVLTWMVRALSLINQVHQKKKIARYFCTFMTYHLDACWTSEFSSFIQFLTESWN